MTNAEICERLFSRSRIVILSGHAGSGKTEIAVNIALELSRGAPAAIADFDIINPFFRTVDARAALERAGVRIVAPQFAGTNVEIPALPGEVRHLFDDASERAVFDVGGDDLGAKAVSSFRDAFLAAGASHIFVFNARRPLTSTVEKAVAAFNEIQSSARVPFSAVANNTHLLGHTTPADLSEGFAAALELSARVGLPLAFNALMAPESRASGAPFAPFLDHSSELGIPVLQLRKHITMEYK